MQEIFAIRKYEMLNNVTLKSFESNDKHIIIETTKNSYGLVFKTSKGEIFKSNHYVTYSLEKKEDMTDYNDQFLPYFADVKQDLPGSIKFEPEIYPNCQLMTEKHGGYLQFWDAKNKEVRRIALNSNIYIPRK